MSAADTEHRTFMLTIDADRGPHLAEMAGFLPASGDVAERERLQVTKDWMTMDGEGVLQELMQYAEWFGEIACADMTEHERAHTLSSMVTFTAAVIARLKNRGYMETPEKRRLRPVIYTVRKSDGEKIEVEETGSMSDELKAIARSIRGEDDE